MPFDAIFYDGQSGHRQQVRVDPYPDAIELTFDSGFYETVDATLLTWVDSDQRSIRLGRSDEAGWRLVIPVGAEPEIRDLVGRPSRYGRWIDRIGLVPALIGFGAVAASVVAFGYLAPHWIAPHVPESWERNLGTAIVGDFGDNRCRDPRGQKALEALVERLEPGATRGPHAIQVAALDIGIFNAAALPGNHIVIFKPAITETEDFEELAGIVAHEIAHVRRRHVTEALIREFGIGALIRLFAGDVGANAQQLVALSYTRKNEAEADAQAIAMLKRAGISPRPTANLFKRLSDEEGPAIFSAEFLESHPDTAGRAKRFEAAFDPKATYRPALDQDDADALFNICSAIKPQKSPANK
jgi:Zn-dependent protease with chaperone function